MVSRKKKLIIGGAIAIGGTAYGVYSLTKHKSKTAQESETQTDTGTGDAGTNTSDDTGSSSSSGSGDGKTTRKTVVEEIPITNYKEALEFANREWNKIKRDNGRTLECQVLGSTHWRAGEWCKVYLPSFDIDGYMYIVRTSQTSEGGDWTTNLSLVDYPPGWGQEEAEDTTEEESSEEENNEEENTDEENNENGEESTEENTT